MNLILGVPVSIFLVRISELVCVLFFVIWHRHKKGAGPQIQKSEQIFIIDTTTVRLNWE